MGFIRRVREEIAAKKAAERTQNTTSTLNTNENSCPQVKHQARIHTIPELTRHDYDSFEICLAFVPDYNREQKAPATPEDPTL